MTQVVSLQTFKQEEGEAHVVIKFDVQQTADIPAKGHLVKL